MNPKIDYLKIALTHNCNLDCKFCAQQFKEHNLFKKEYLKKILSNKEIMNSLRLIIFTGGEPFIDYNLLKECCILCKENKLEVGIFTNSTLINEEKLRELKNIGVDWIRTSINGANAETNDSLLKNTKSFDRIIKGIRTLIRVGYSPKLRVTIMKQNILEIKEIIDLLKKEGVNEIDFRPYTHLNKNELDKEFELSKKELEGVMKTLIEYRKNNKDIKIKFLPSCYDFVFNQMEDDFIAKCSCGRKFLYIEPNGDIKICPGFIKKMGNIEKDDLLDLWYNFPLLKTIRNPSPCSDCKKCEYWNKCKFSECFVVTYNKFGNLNNKNPQCPL